MWKHLKKWWANEGAMVALRGLDDRLLADIGLERETLRARAGGEAQPPEPPPTPAGTLMCEGR